MTDRFDIDTFTERSAIMEFCGGASRFEAETQAAKLQGVERWQALKICKEEADADRGRHTGGCQNPDTALAGKPCEDDLSGMQRRAEEENGPLPEHQQIAGRADMALSSLRSQRRGVL